MLKKLGQRIREERKKLNLTQEQLAEFLNLSHSYVGQIERGERSITLNNLISLANRLGVTVDYLLSDSLDVEDEQYFDELRQIFAERSLNEKKMVLDIIKIMFAHLDLLK